MRIAVIGAGGVGGVFGSALAKAGADVTFVARGAHLAAMREKGLRVEGGRGETLVRPAQATDDPTTIGPVDLVLFCVKLWDVESAGERIRPLVGADTAVIPLQNGIDASERLAPILGAGAVMGGVAQVSATIAEPGLVRQTGTLQKLVFGELDGVLRPRGPRFLAACREAGFDAELAEDIQKALWEKFVLLVAMSSITAVTRLPVGKLRDDPDLQALYRTVMGEVTALGRARGVRLAPDLPERLLVAVRSFPPTGMASMAVDLLRGNRIELPWLAGKVAALSREMGIPSPAATTLYAALKPYVAGAPA
ncbi:MAG: 2-dehydropantoate 2-reductase [Alphaproteobacteria bacterium]|nr:2-dehydropantoate 2-reductase [Alphaproteobacteria bacterium]